MSPGQVAQTMASLKAAPAPTVVAVEPASGLRLVAVSRDHIGDDALVERLAAWRRRHADRYPTQFEVTFAGTRAWLRDRVVDAPSRVLLLLVPAGEEAAAGHLGFDRGTGGGDSIEIINLVRGDRERLADGAMPRCVEAAVGWAADELGVTTVWGRPFSDNRPAIRCLEAAGFAAGELLPLRRRAGTGRVEYRPLEPGDTAPGDRHWLRMTRQARR